MKGHLAALFCMVLFWTSGIPALANAQTGSKAAAQPHLDKARAAAYEPGNDLTVLSERVCAPALSDRGPVEPPPQIAASLAERTVPPRSERYTEPAKVFDNLYYAEARKTPYGLWLQARSF